MAEFFKQYNCIGRVVSTVNKYICLLYKSHRNEVKIKLIAKYLPFSPAIYLFKLFMIFIASAFNQLWVNINSNNINRNWCKNLAQPLPNIDSQILK